jgi:hypothetical protein
MKAEHRHELHTNALKASMTRIVKGFQEDPRSNLKYGWVVGIIVVALVAAWFFAGSSGKYALLWRELDNESDPAQLEIIANEGQGTLPGRTAQFQRARLLIQQGLRGLFTSNRPTAISDLEEARRLFTQLSAECKDSPLLTQEALMNMAKAEEALVAIPKENNPAQARGDLDKAMQIYRSLAEGYSDSFLGKQAAEHLQQLETNKSQVVKFYAELAKLAEGKKK